MPRKRGELISNTLKATSTVFFLIAVAGCASQVAIDDLTIPDPLVEKIPLDVGIKYPESFGHFVHEEQVIGKEKWTIDLGQSNALLFTKLFSAMFEKLTVVDASVDPRDVSIDAWIEPSIDAFEFSVPSQSQTDSFAVWIRYRIKIFDKDGNEIANWPLSAYGKSLSTTMGGDNALRRAAVLAMRDAAALIVMQMDRVTGISALVSKLEPSVATLQEAPETEAALPADEQGPPVLEPEESEATASEDAMRPAAEKDGQTAASEDAAIPAPVEEEAQTTVSEEPQDETG